MEATIRKAQTSDVRGMMATDHVARASAARRRFIRVAVRQGRAYVAVERGTVAGYAVLEYSFFGRGFIAMLIVERDHRRRGFGTALVRHLERRCRSDRIFTSTNQSNRPMQALLKKLGYTRSGIVRDLDPGDPELFYSRALTPR